MPRFEAKNPDFRRIATETFGRQQAMRTLGFTIARMEPGEVDLAMDYSPALTQQNGFVHAGIITAGLDTACGIAAFTLMPAGSDILTVEFKLNLVGPAKGDRIVAEGFVVKPGRTLAITRGEVHAEEDGKRTLVALMQQTLMVMRGKADA